MPDGRYSAELPGADILDGGGLPIGRTYAFSLLKRAGDMNGDGVVNFADYGVVGANFDPLQGTEFRAGDANGDGAVNFADYGVIGANFGPIPLDDVQLDFGDAPENLTRFPTQLANNGARHILGGTTFLGAGVDAEGDGIPSAGADGDDTNNTDDEDGVVWGTLVAGGSNTINVTVASAGAVFLNAWIDLNGWRLGR